MRLHPRKVCAGWVLLLALLMAGSAARGALVNFDFRGNAGLFDFEAPSGTVTNAGIILNFQALVDGLSGDPLDLLNATASHFGVNNSVVGDNEDQIDNLFGQEAVRITFSTVDPADRVYLRSINVNEFGAGDQGELQYEHLVIPFASSGDVNAQNQRVDEKALIVTYTGTGNGFGFDGMLVEITPIPEPGTFVFLGLGAALARSARRQRREMLLVGKDGPIVITKVKRKRYNELY